MIQQPILLGGYSALFTALALYFGWRTIRARSYPIEVTEHLLHVAMSIVMLAMAYPAWHHWPRIPQLVLFIAATGWFALMIVLQATGATAPGRHGRLGLWYRVMHTVMMAAMVWMIAVMPAFHEAGLTRSARLTGFALVAAMGALGAIELAAFLRRTADTRPAPRPAEALDAEFTAATGGIGLAVAHPDNSTAAHSHAESVGVLAMLLGMAAMCAAML